MDDDKVYFDINAEYPFVSFGDALDVNFLYELQGYTETDFGVRVLGNDFCLLDENNECHLTYGLWGRAMNLSETVRIKVKNNFSGKVPLSFEIHNSKNGDVFKTPEKFLWMDTSYPGYIDNLNENIQLYSGYKRIAVNTNTQPHTKIPYVYLFLPTVLIFLCFVIYKMIKSRSGKD